MGHGRTNRLSITIARRRWLKRNGRTGMVEKEEICCTGSEDNQAVVVVVGNEDDA